MKLIRNPDCGKCYRTNDLFFFNKETAGGKKKGERQRENLSVKKDLRNLTTNHNSISYLNIDSN